MKERKLIKPPQIFYRLFEELLVAENQTLTLPQSTHCHKTLRLNLTKVLDELNKMTVVGERVTVSRVKTEQGEHKWKVSLHQKADLSSLLSLINKPSE